MASKDLTDVVKQAEKLTPSEQLELAALLLEKARRPYGGMSENSNRRKWSEASGIAPYPLVGEDAQAWVTRTRHEADEKREQQLRKT
jgi:hypothetical protein